MGVIRCKKHLEEKECYLVEWRPKGRKGTHCQRHIEGTEAEALAFWMEMLHGSRRANHQPVGIDPTVVDVLPIWMDIYRNDHLANTVKDLNCCLVPLVRYFGNFHLSELTAPILVEEYKRQRLETRVRTRKRKGEDEETYRKRIELENTTLTKRTIAKELTYFSSFLRWCHDNGYLHQPIRIKNFPLKQTTRRVSPRPLDRETITSLVNAIEPKYQGILLAMTDAGLRISEALSITVEKVDLARRIVTVRGKGDKERIMVIATARLHSTLTEAIGQKKKGLLFANPRTGKPYSSIKRAIERAAEKAGIDQHLYHHLMRHSFGTNAIMAGVSLKGVQDMLGHVSAQTTQQYLHMAGVYFQDEGFKIGAYLDAEGPTDIESQGAVT